MKLSRNILTSIWMLISLNILMSFVGIWAFSRMIPGIHGIRANEPNMDNLEALSVLESDCNLGAWILVFMAFCFFLASMAFLRTMKRMLIQPMENIQNVVDARRNGDLKRRCPSTAPQEDIRKLYASINELLDN